MQPIRHPVRCPMDRVVSSLLISAGYVTAALGLAIAFLSAGAATASAAGLLEPLSPAETATVTGTAPSPYAARDRLVGLDYAYLEANMVPRGIDKAADRLDRAPAAGEVRVELFPDVELTLERTRLEKARGGGYIWKGSVRGESGFATLVVIGGKVTGQIQIEGRVFTITPVSGGVHRVSEMDPGSFPGDIVVPAPVGQTRDKSALEAEPRAKSRIRVLVPYTKAARAASGGISGAVNLAISLANDAARNAGVKIKYVLAARMLVKGYNEKGFSTDLDKVSANAGKFKPVHKKRNNKKADLVAFLTRPCGRI